MLNRLFCSLILISICVSVSMNADAQTLFSDDFSDGDDAGWTQLDGTAGQSWGPGQWDARSGRYQLDSTGAVAPGGAPFSLVISYLADTDTEEFQDGYLRGKIQADTMGTQVNLTIRGANSELPDDPGFRYYGFTGSTASGTFEILRGDGVTDLEILGQMDPAEFPFVPGEQWNIEGSAIGDELTLKVWKVGEPVPVSPQLSVTDDTYSGGGVLAITSSITQGFNSAARVSGSFDDFVFSKDPLVPFTINGSGETYQENFDSMGTETGFVMPNGWSGEDSFGSTGNINTLGLTDGPLDSQAFSVAGIVNVGGNPERFDSSDAGRLAIWKTDVDGNGSIGQEDAVADGATDRALGNGRVLDDDNGSLHFAVSISDKPLRAFVAEWDLEVWGGDPESIFRGADGGGYSTDLKVGGTSYYSDNASLVPGDLFDSAFDGVAGQPDSTLINGNVHAIRGKTSGIVEVSATDGAVGNAIQWTFNADHGNADGGWIQAIDNVKLRALAAGDAQADGDVDPADLIQLLAGGAFGQGNIDATWGQGDFDNDGDFDGTDILAVVQGLAGEFPKTYAHDPTNSVPDVLINPATGNITLDTNGTTIGSIVMDSSAGIFNGPNSPMWDAPGDFAADIDTQISMPISFTNPGYSGVDDLGDGIIGNLAPGFDILADLTIKYLDPNGDLLDAEAHIVPEPSSIVLAALGMLGMMGCLRRRRQLA